MTQVLRLRLQHGLEIPAEYGYLAVSCLLCCPANLRPSFSPCANLCLLLQLTPLLSKLAASGNDSALGVVAQSGADCDPAAIDEVSIYFTE